MLAGQVNLDRVLFEAMKPMFRFPRAPFAFTLAASLALAGGGVLMTQLMRLAACPLCIIQRMLYLALALSAAAGLAMAASSVGRRLGALLMAAAAGTGAFVAGYQTWIQRFGQDTGCSGRMTWWEELVDWAGSKAPLLFQSDGICSDPGWFVLGLSIAEWSLILFTGFFLLSLYTLLRRR
jgi:disulfide bond formation protein DsbB